MRFEIKGESVFATTGGRDFDPYKPVLIFLHGHGRLSAVTDATSESLKYLWTFATKSSDCTFTV